MSYARKFHQFLVVGLIEACKGISELFPEVLGSSSSTGIGAGIGVGPGSSSGTNLGSCAGAGILVPSAAAVVSAREAYVQLQVRSLMFEDHFITQCNL